MLYTSNFYCLDYMTVTFLSRKIFAVDKLIKLVDNFIQNNR